MWWTQDIQVHCRVCAAALTADTDMRKHFYTGTVTFGPNVKSNALHESKVASYKVYWTDAYNMKIGSAIGTVVGNQNAASDSACCRTDLYTIDLAGIAIPTSAKYLTVVPVLDASAGNLELPRGFDLIKSDVGTDVPTP